MTLEPLPRGWHKNWQPTCCQEVGRPCRKVKNIHNSEVSSNFSLWSFIFWTWYIPTAINNQLTFIFLVLLQYLFNVFCSPDIWVLHHHNRDSIISYVFFIKTDRCGISGLSLKKTLNVWLLQTKRFYCYDVQF